MEPIVDDRDLLVHSASSSSVSSSAKIEDKHHRDFVDNSSDKFSDTDEDEELSTIYPQNLHELLQELQTSSLI